MAEDSPSKVTVLHPKERKPGLLSPADLDNLHVEVERTGGGLTFGMVIRRGPAEIKPFHPKADDDGTEGAA